MKTSLLIVGCFVSGVLLSYFNLIPQSLVETDYSIYVLYVMMFFVGMFIGFDLRKLYQPIKEYKWKIVFIPMATIVGSLLAVFLLSFFITSINSRETVAIGAGFGYYSLSAVFLKELAGDSVGMMALVSNMTRELTTLLFAPFIVGFFGKLSLISAAGATSIDTSLPIIAKYSGSDLVVIAIFHGLLVDFSVPVILSFLYL